jgi:hypothetical protein
LRRQSPHNHIGCVLKIHHPPDTSHKWDHQSVPIWKGDLLGDSVLPITVNLVATNYALYS